MHVDRLDHLVFTVTNVEATCTFYVEVLGMQEVTFGGGRKALQFGRQKINLHPKGGKFEPLPRNPAVGCDDLCFVTTVPIDDVIEHMEHCGIPIELGPVVRTGVIGPLISVYVRDPDGNLIEIANQE